MRYGVYQIQLTDEVIDRVNSGVSSNQVPEFDAKMHSMLGNPKKGLALNLYKKVAIIEATGLENVFEIGNIGPESKITRLGLMCSVSVGDIIEAPDGVRSVVASFGFEPVMDA